MRSSTSSDWLIHRTAIAASAGVDRSSVQTFAAVRPPVSVDRITRWWSWAWRNASSGSVTAVT